LGGAALTALSLTFGAGVANAQSTGSQAQESETIVVTGAHHSINGELTAETIAKSRATIGQQYIGEQSAEFVLSFRSERPEDFRRSVSRSGRPAWPACSSGPR
jgi:hypothetical protein